MEPHIVDRPRPGQASSWTGRGTGRAASSVGRRPRLLHAAEIGPVQCIALVRVLGVRQHGRVLLQPRIDLGADIHEGLVDARSLCTGSHPQTCMSPGLHARALGGTGRRTDNAEPPLEDVKDLGALPGRGPVAASSSHPSQPNPVLPRFGSGRRPDTEPRVGTGPGWPCACVGPAWRGSAARLRRRRTSRHAPSVSLGRPRWRP